MLANDEQWALFVTTTLQERNEIENVAKWTCGRPTTMGTGPDSDNDDFQV